MQVTCPQCSSRYKLPDEKVKAKGTKVRCPRCQHAFYIYPEKAEAPAAASRPSMQRAPAPPPVRPNPKPDIAEPLADFMDHQQSRGPDRAPAVEEPSDDFDSHFDSDRTVVSQVDPSLFSRPAKPESKASPASPAPIIGSKSRVESAQDVDIAPSKEFATHISDVIRPASLEDEASRPFGDATLAQIQVQIKKEKKVPWRAIGLGTFVLTLIGLSWYVIENRKAIPAVKDNTSSGPSFQAEPVIPTKLNKPSKWYRDDPLVYQDFLNQMAALPSSEQSNPEKRALISEALIMNGVLSGNNDQVVTGLGYASSLLAAYPNAIYGFGGLALFAIFQEDTATLENLLKRWPQAGDVTPDLRLIRMIVAGRHSKEVDGPKEALRLGQSLLDEYPEFTRALAWFLLFATENPSLTDMAIVGTNDYSALVKQFGKTLQYFKANQIPLPELYRNLERKLSRKGLLNASAKDEKKSPAPPPVEQKKQASPPPAKTTKTAAAIKPKVAPAKKPSPAVPSQLPKPDPDLIALNMQSQSTKQKGQLSFSLGQQQLQQNKVNEAINSFQEAIRSDPSLSEAYKQLGIIYMGRQQRDRALKNLKLYLQLKPDSTDRQIVLGWIESLQ